MNTFANAINDNINNAEARTLNGMKAFATTANKNLDFFGKAGSSRGVPLTDLFAAALAENEDLALRALLWTRDVRGGAGERFQFRTLLGWLENHKPAVALKLMKLIPEVGRWDDLFVYQNPINRERAFEMIAHALIVDQNGLCAKWMPRKGPNAVALTQFLGFTPRQYRKLLVGLTNVVETKMCAKEWDEINFSHVPSLASARYQKAFGRNAPQKYAEYINDLQSGSSNAKINAGAVYPYDVLKSVGYGNAAVADEQWKALPNFAGDSKLLPIVDVSGSMQFLVASKITALDVALSLGLYFSEKNTGPFRDVFMTYSGSAKFQKLRGTLSERLRQLQTSDWLGSTDLSAAFTKILETAVNANASPEDMPDYLIILTDMQFNQVVHRGADQSAMQMIDRKFEEAGYKRPNVIFWNLNSYYSQGNTPVQMDTNGTALVSGFSPAIAKTVLSANLENYTPMNVMLETLMSDRYDYS